jgi:hypothetical protein
MVDRMMGDRIAAMLTPHMIAGTGDVAAHHRQLLALCDELEAVADALPRVDAQKCLFLSRAIGPVLTAAQKIEEVELFRDMARTAPERPALAATLEWLRVEHQVDLCYAEEVQDALRAYGEGCRQPSPEAAGFMLRGFFEGLRRHVAFEAHLAAMLSETAAGSAAQGFEPGEVGDLDVPRVGDADDVRLPKPGKLT